MSLDILVVGNGAREHALCWKIDQSSAVGHVICAPGNAGTSEIAENVPIDVLDIDGIVQLSEDRSVDLIVIGPEAPLAAGLADALRARDFPVFGPSQAAARIESSKAWSKALMLEAKVPTARSVTHSSVDDALAALDEFDIPVVIKADGLAAGKGVVIADSRHVATEAVKNILGGDTFGAAGSTIIIEEYLHGMEVSLFGVTDGETIVHFLPSCDYKRAGTGDTGQNTGGMGAYAPVPSVSERMVENLLQTVLGPIVDMMRHRDCPMNGVLYAGLMLTDAGPKVLEFNARFGDPEIQVLLPLLETDFALLLQSIAHGQLRTVGDLKWSNECAVGVVAASGGYPGSYATGFPISGLDLASEDSEVFQAGTALAGNGAVQTSGGRVLTAVATGGDFETARERSYDRIRQISFQDMQFRNDIALRETAVR